MSGMEGKTVVITGASSGIGLETARALAKMGARIIAVVRNRDKAQHALGGMSADLVIADLYSLVEVRKAAAEIRARYERLDVLINNAGMIHATRELTVDGFERTFALNHLAPFLLSYELRALLLAGSRLVTVASEGHRFPRFEWDDLVRMDHWKGQWGVYGASKLCNIWFAREAARRLASAHVTSNVLHPGTVASNFGMETGGALLRTLAKIGRPLLLSSEGGARTSVYMPRSAPGARRCHGPVLEEEQDREAIATRARRCERVAVVGAVGEALRGDLGVKWLVVLAAAACSPGGSASSVSANTNGSAATPPIEASNIARADYVGPRVCGDCHADEYARWSQSLHRLMNARAEDPGAIVGDFDNAVVHYAGGEVHFTHDGEGYIVAVRKAGHDVRYRVTRTIGRRGLQEYVGIEAGHTDEVRLPFGWWPRRGGWYPQPYFDPWLGDEASFDAYAPVREPWAERCPWCHSTYPFEQRIERAQGPQGVGHGLEQLFAGRPGSRMLALDEQVTTGISCESCHLGGRMHAAGGAIHFVPQGATPREAGGVPSEPFADERRDAAVVNAVCAQCHSGPSPRLADHTALRNSSEALDLGASPCTGIKCTDCHDPHRAESDVTTRSIAACTRCHAALADPAAARAHAGNGHETTSCLDCHMPRMVMGIDRFVRTHRISSPTDRAVLADAGPNACNLCHLDRSIAWTTDELARGWEVALSPEGWTRAYRDLDAPVGEVWLASSQPTYRLIAAHAYARSPGARAALPRLLDGLADPLAYVRSWTVFAIEDVLGRTLTELDPRADVATRTRELAALRAKLK